MPPPKLIFEKPSVKDVLGQLTPFVYDEDLEGHFDELLERRKSTIRKIRSVVSSNKFSPESVVAIVKEDPEEALNAIISVMGLSQEEFFRHVTLLRLQRTAEMAAEMEEETEAFTSEWKMKAITKRISTDSEFATSIVRLLFGQRRNEMRERVPRFLLDKLDEKKIRLEPDALIDSLVRTGLKGRYDVKKGKPIVDTAVEILKVLKVEFSDGELSVPGVSRKMDIVVPNIIRPLVLVECGVFATTARELSEKALVEGRVRQDVAKTYPEAVLVRILDGIGWLARGGGALKGVIEESHYVLTGKTIETFAEIIRHHVPREFFG